MLKIAVVPIDNRPICYDLIQDILSIDKNIQLYMPNISNASLHPQAMAFSKRARIVFSISGVTIPASSLHASSYNANPVSVFASFTLHFPKSFMKFTSLYTQQRKGTLLHSNRKPTEEIPCCGHTNYRKMG